MDWSAVTGVLVALIVAYWYADRKRHPRRGSLAAFLIFVAVFGGLVAAGLVLAAGVIYALDLGGPAEATAVKTLVPILFFAVIAPAFLYARRLIQRPPAAGSPPAGR